MGKIVISENVSLDGVAQDPTGDEGFGRGGWFLGAGDRDGRYRAWAAVAFDEARSARALLLGRRSDEWFATRWASRTGEFADRLNSMPKYVVSSTRHEPRWANATVLTGDVAREVATLKQRIDGEILVYASTRLVRTLIEYRLADQLRLMVHPFVLGAGERLFGDTSDRLPLSLVANRTVGAGLAYVTYELVPGTARAAVR